MKNLNISFIEEENCIKYDEYYFNGIAPPKEIEFKNITINSFEIFWKMEESILNIFKNQIKYKVEIRNEDLNNKFDEVYNGDKTNCTIKNLKSNTNYEVKICVLSNNFNANCFELKKVKTSIFGESLILLESKRLDEFLSKIYEWTGYDNMELLYRGTRDGMTGESFHNKCNNKGPTICLFKNDKDNIFGGYASTSWTSCNNYISASNSFLFTLINMYGTEPTKFPNTKSNYSLYDYYQYGPTFGAGHDIYTFVNNKNASGFSHSYQDTLGKGNSIFTGDLNSSYFILKEIEVFKIFKK